MNRFSVQNLVTAFLLSVALAGVLVHGQDVPRTAGEKVAYLRKQFAPGLSARDANELVAYFADPDPTVRLAAYIGATNVTFSSVDDVLGLRQASMIEPDETAREQAIVAYGGLRADGSFRRITPATVAEFEKAALAGETAKRVVAIEVLGSLRAALPETYIKLLKDEEPAIRLAVTQPVGTAMSSVQGSQWPVYMPLLKELIGLIMREPAARGPGGSALRAALHRCFGLDEMTKLYAQLDASAELDDRALAAALRWEMYWSKPDRGGVTRERMVEAVRCKYAWVRAVAMDAIFRTSGPVQPVDGRAILRDAVGDANADVARDAALRLIGVLPLGFGRLTYDGVDAHIRRSTAPNGPLVVPTIDAKEPLQRVQTLKALDDSNAVGNVIAATKLFGDPDPGVAQEARATALRLIKANEAKQPK